MLPALASSELRILAEDDELHYKRAERLLADYSDALKNLPPSLRSNSPMQVMCTARLTGS